MAFSELTSFTRQFERSSPDDAAAHGQHLVLLRELHEYIKSKNAKDLAACLSAAARVVEVLAVPGGRLDRSRLKEIASGLLSEVEEALARADVAGKRSTPDAGPERKPTSGLNPALAGVNDMVLGKMLVALGHVTEKQVEEALEVQRSRGMRIGECLLLQGAVSPDRLLEVLKLQEEMRASGSSSATGPVAEAPEREVGAPTAPAPEDRRPAAMRVTKEMFLGEVLLGAEMISPDQLERAMHMHHNDGVRVGDALLHMGALSQEELRCGVELHSRLRHIAGLPTPDGG